MPRAGVVLLCLAAAAASPLGLLLAGPLLLGAPHLAADVACLLRLRDLRRPRFLAAVALPLALLTGLQVAGLSGLPVPLSPAVLGAASVAAAWLAARGTGACAWLAGAGALALAGLALARPALLTLCLAHAHNVVGVGLWLWWTARGGGRPDWRAAAACLACAGAIGAGGLDFALGGAPVFGLEWGELAGSLAPGLIEPWGGRLVLSFAFLQAVHYAVWLRWLPEELGMSGWLDGLPGPVKAFAACAALAVPVAALWGPVRARDAYLALGSFHAWLELSAAAHLLALPRPSARRVGDAAAGTRAAVGAAA